MHMGRFDTIDKWVRSSHLGHTLNLGSKATQWGDVRVDVNRPGRPTVVADCRALPFKAAKFDTVLFTDVIEHLPKDGENAALGEIARVLRLPGRLLLTTPNDRFFLRFLDPAWWLFGHRHYARERLLQLLAMAAFEPESVRTIGDPIRDTLALLLLTSSPSVSRLFEWASRLLGDQKPDEYRYNDSGFTHFIVARLRPDRKHPESVAVGDFLPDRR